MSVGGDFNCEGGAEPAKVVGGPDMGEPSFSVPAPTRILPISPVSLESWACGSSAFASFLVLRLRAILLGAQFDEIRPLTE